MSADALIAELEKYREELAGILGRFSESQEGIHIYRNDIGRVREIVIELRDLFNDSLGAGNVYSHQVLEDYNEGVSNFVGTPSYASVERLVGVVSAAIKRMKRKPDLVPGQAATASDPGVQLAKLGAVRKTVDSLLDDEKGRYFDPPFVLEHFEIYNRAASNLKDARPDLFNDLPDRTVPEPSGTTDFEGRGFIQRHHLERLVRDIDYIFEVQSQTQAADTSPEHQPSSAPSSGSIDPSKLTPRQIAESMTVPQWWAVVLAVGSVFGFGFWLGGFLSPREVIRETAQDDRVTSHFSTAVSQLASDKLAERLGGIYSLERIARASEDFHQTAIEMLTAFVREHASKELFQNAQEMEETKEVQEWDLRFWPPEDVQAALFVIARRERLDDEGMPKPGEWNEETGRNSRLHLADTALTLADLRGADLAWADLTEAALNAANLDGADLTQAILAEADLTVASFSGAKLMNADLTDTRLNLADLRGADLTDAKLGGADLTVANLAGANLSGADVSGVKGLKQQQLSSACADRPVTAMFLGQRPFEQPPSCTLSSVED